MLWHFLVERHVDGLTPSMYDVEERESRYAVADNRVHSVACLLRNRSRVKSTFDTRSREAQ